MPRILAIDYGKKRTGLAITDPMKIIASGLATVATDDLWKFLKGYVLREPVELFVLGEPRNLDGRDTDATPLVRPFFVADEALEIADDARAQLGEGAAEVLDAALFALTDLSERGTWAAEQIEAALRSSLVEGLGLKARHAFGPLRTAVSGQKISPPLFESMEILGPESTLARLRSLRVTL